MSSTSEYLVGEAIGEGSYGRVLHARHKATQRDVAIKVVAKVSLKKHPHLFDSVWTERTLLSQWNSEYVVKLWASFHDSECLYLVMECETGGDLTNLIQEGRQNNFDVWSLSIPHYGMQLVNALEFIHTEGVIHADLTPDNIVISNHGRLKLADFGSAVSLDTNQQRKNQPMGTSDYASPEVLRASTNLTFAVDLWSLGCIYCALWVGQSPFHSESDDLAVRAVLDYAAGIRNDGSVATNGVHDPTWQQLIFGLLLPQPSLRIGMSDIGAVGEKVEYRSIRLCEAWSGVELSLEPRLIPSTPKWVSQADDSEMRDGSLGWSAFLL